VKIFIC